MILLIIIPLIGFFRFTKLVIDQLAALLVLLIMAALWNRAGIYIFALCFLLLSASFFFFFFLT